MWEVTKPHGPSGYTPGYTPSDVYELNSLSETLSTRSYERHDRNDLTSLFPHGRGQPKDASPVGRGGYICKHRPFAMFYFRILFVEIQWCMGYIRKVYEVIVCNSSQLPLYYRSGNPLY